ncbi:MAG: histidine kinase [Parachlamydia sp.]|nr:MAG: histidine kinase [Parachlamydia sp.]
MKTIKVIIESKIDHVPVLSKAVRAICSTLVQDEILLFNMELCIFEAVINVIKYVYKKQPGNYIEVITTLEKSEINLCVITPGISAVLPLPKKELEFDPKDINSIPESGMGLFLIHQIMDEVGVKKIENENMLLMKKYLSLSNQ